MSAPDNTPAFPRDHRYDGHNGLTMRDWFAGQALSSGLVRMIEHEAGWLTEASVAYVIADAMLAARQQPAPDTEAMEHVACFDEGEFRWLSGRKPRDCELYAARKTGGAS